MKKMKRLFCIILAVLCGMAAPASAAPVNGQDNTPRLITLVIGSPMITVNEVEQRLDAEGTVPFIENGRTLVPLRAIFEALSAKVEWDPETQTVTGTRGGAVILLTIGSSTAYKNGEEIRLDTAPRIVNGRTMVPLRFIAESLGAEVKWIGETQTIVISQTAVPTGSGRFIQLGGVRITVGDSLASVRSKLGDADRIDPSLWDFVWHVYNSDYSRFVMVGIKDDAVAAVYTNSKGFAAHHVKYGDVDANNTSVTNMITPDSTNSIVHYDQNDGNKAHACLILPDVPHTATATMTAERGDDFYRAQEMECFDATNAFRVNHGMPPLLHDETAAITARKHSQDMADRDYFSHTTPEGLEPWDRFINNGGAQFYMCGENICFDEP